MNIKEQLIETAKIRAQATAADTPGNILLVVARISREDAVLMEQAAAYVDKLEKEVARCHARLEIDHVWQVDAEEDRV